MTEILKGNDIAVGPHPCGVTFKPVGLSGYRQEFRFATLL